MILDGEARGGRWTVTRGLSLDPKDDKNTPFPAELSEAISATMPVTSPKWLASHLTLQRDEASGGPLVVENVARALVESTGAALKSPMRDEVFDMRAVWSRHAELLRNLSFKDLDLLRLYSIPAVHHGSID